MSDNPPLENLADEQPRVDPGWEPMDPLDWVRVILEDLDDA